MSDLQRDFLRAKLAKLPSLPPMPYGDDEDDEDEDEDEEETASGEYGNYETTLAEEEEDAGHSSASSASSTATIRPPPRRIPRKPKPKPKAQYTALSWQEYFDENIEVRVPASTPTTTTSEKEQQQQHQHHQQAFNTFNAYLIPPKPETSTSPDNDQQPPPLFILHHGAGSSALTFSLLAAELRRGIPGCGVLAYDARGHGRTVVSEGEGGEMDMRLEVLSGDCVGVVEGVLGVLRERGRSGGGGGGGGGDFKTPPLVLVGHSMGGAVVVDVAWGGRLGGRVEGYVVLDVVEGSAIDALQSMQTYLTTRPTTFPSLPAAIEWHLRSRTIRNPTSARVSVPGLLTTTTTSSLNSADTSTSWRWRTNLHATQPFWTSWFTHLSRKFLAAKGGKLLVLAGTDRLDRELMIGQMQGRYQLVVVPEVGHFVHEDDPGRVATAIIEFHKRQAPIKLPPKVGQSMALGQKVVGPVGGAGTGLISKT
ncbi:Alpha/Beta hydrolase protein [Peziza echinospora]|nr:Alpha/Beta hydrolase protein [Peziza echinospora]